MPDRVHERLAADAIDLIADERMQGPGPALDDDAKADLFLDPELLLHPAERLLEVVAASRRRAQATHGVAALIDDASHQLEHAIERRPRGRIGRHVAGRDMQLHRRADQTLQQGVVQVLRDARPLRQPFLEPDVEPPRDLVHPEAVQAGRSEHDRDRAGELKPGRLPDTWSDGEADGGFSAAPLIVAVGRHDAEAVRAGTEIRVDRRARGDGLAPVAVKAIEPIAEPHPLRHGQTQAGIGERQPLAARRDVNRAAQIDGVPSADTDSTCTIAGADPPAASAGSVIDRPRPSENHTRPPGSTTTDR